MNLREMWKYRRKETITFTAMVVLVSMLNGRAGARLITQCIKKYYKQNKKKQTVKDLQEKYCRTALSRLEKDGLVVRKNGGMWVVTNLGKKFIEFMTKKNIVRPPTPRAESDTVVIFDIREKESGKRKSLRFELVARGFTAFQKSVWLGKGPLDEEFIDFLKTKEIIDCVHIFSIHKRGTV